LPAAAGQPTTGTTRAGPPCAAILPSRLAEIAHRVVHDRRFVEVHLTDHEPKPKRSAKAGERPRFFHAESHAVLDTGGGVADGEEDAFAAEFKMDAEFQACGQIELSG